MCDISAAAGARAGARRVVLFYAGRLLKIVFNNFQITLDISGNKWYNIVEGVWAPAGNSRLAQPARIKEELRWNAKIVLINGERIAIRIRFVTGKADAREIFRHVRRRIRNMILNLTRKQIVDLIFALELAEDNAPELRRWDPLRDELRTQLAVLDTANVFVDRFAEDPEPYSDLDSQEV